MGLEDEAANELAADQEAALLRARDAEIEQQRRVELAAQEVAEADRLKATTLELIQILRRHGNDPVDFVLGEARHIHGWIVFANYIGTPDTPSLYGGGTKGEASRRGCVLTADGSTYDYVTPGEFTDARFMPYGFRQIETSRLTGFGMNAFTSVPPLSHDQLVALAKRVLSGNYANVDVLTEFEKQSALDPSLRKKQRKIIDNYEKVKKYQEKQRKKLYPNFP